MGLGYLNSNFNLGAAELAMFGNARRSSSAMLRRYLGKIPVTQLKRLPTTLERGFGRAV